MLDAMRRGALNWLSKILLALLIVAFAVWGVADVFRGYGRGTLARIGKTEISVEEYRQAYQEELDSISRRMGRRLTPEQAKLVGLEQRALQRLISAAAIDAHIDQMHLALSDATIADLIRKEPSFQQSDGSFSSAKFQQYLRQAGMSEARYVQLRRKEEVREQLTESLTAGIAPPQVLMDRLHSYREETRVIEHFTPDYDKLIKLPEPGEAELKAYYEDSKRQFMVPEMRRINVLLLTRADVKARLPIAEEEVKASYEREKERYNIPEKRRVQQLAFPEKAAAEKAYAELAGAKDFNEAAAKLGFKPSDIELGLLARKDMIDPKIADAVFTLTKDELSKPVEGRFANVLLRVTDIEPGKQRTYDDVKGEIRDRLAEERASQEIQALHEKAENERSAGKPLQEIGQVLKIAYRAVPEIDASGKTADGKPALENPEAARIAQAAFSGAAGIESEATELPDGGYAWIDVISTTPEKQKPFETVQAEVKAGFLEQERRKQVAALAGKLVERLNSGEPVEALAKETGGKAETTSPSTRTTSPQGLPYNAVQQAFTLARGGATSAATADGKARIILRVRDVIAAPPATEEQTKRLKEELARQMQEDVLAEYIAGLQTRFGVSVNEAALKQALGSERGQPETE
jgi:peptidyl-prolyl cis-trans isomerase D